MAALKRFIEWYFGIPAADPGQGTAWSFTAKSTGPAWMPPWLILLCCLMLAGYVICIYLRDAKSLPLKKRLALIALRMALICLLLLVLTELTLSVERTGLPFVAVLIDDSASMGLEDQYSDDDLQKASSALLNEIQLERTAKPGRAGYCPPQEAMSPNMGIDQLGASLAVYKFARTC